MRELLRSPLKEPTVAPETSARRIVCAWCEPSPHHGADTGRIPVSHTICRQHATEMLLELVGLKVVREGEFKMIRRSK